MNCHSFFNTVSFFILFFFESYFYLQVIRAANSRTADNGGLQVPHIGWSMYCANVRAVMALPVGTMINKATHKYRKAGSGPKASFI